MLDIIEFQEDLIGMDGSPATVLPAIVGQDMFHCEALGFIEGKDSIIEHIHRRLGKLRGIEFPEGKRPVGIHDRLEIDSTHSLDRADHEGILRKEISRIETLYLSLPETGIGLLQESYLFFGKVQILAVLLFFKAKEALILGFYVLFDPDIADRTGAYSNALQTKMIGNPDRTPGRMLKRKMDHFLPHISRSLIRKAFGDRRSVGKAFKSPFLESPLVLIELASGNAVVPTGLGHVSDSFCKL
jgi:hypothetical protein